jgi:hypothetical protein
MKYLQKEKGPNNRQNNSKEVQRSSEKMSTSSGTNSTGKYFTYLEPSDANKLLLSLKKPKLFTDNIEAFTTLFRTFQVGLARHCALLACVPEASQKEISAKTLTSFVDRMQWLGELEYSDKDDDVSDSGSMERENAKFLLSSYKSHLKHICKGVHDPQGKDLLDFIRKEGLTKYPKVFLNLMRQKKKGVWKTSDEYSSEKLYDQFDVICDLCRS